MKEITLKKKTNGFTVIPQHLTQDLNLNNKSLGLLVRLLSLPPTWKFTEAGLSNRFNIGQTELRTSLKSLESNGYLLRTKNHNDKGFFSGSTWIVSDSPMENNPYLENPILDNPNMDYPSMDNLKQLNTNQLNTNQLNTNLSQKQPFFCALKRTSNGCIDEYCTNCYIINSCPFPSRPITEADVFDVCRPTNEELYVLMHMIFNKNTHYNFQERKNNNFLTEIEKLYFELEDD